MGARTFMVSVDGDDLLSAFRAAVDEAQWRHGHGGYTGTIAEKNRVQIVTPPRPMTDEEKKVWAARLLEDGADDPTLAWIEDKWAPAAAVRLDAGGWLFFGWASE